ncbi:MAG: prolyl oligopeptidase family serine peptidase [Gammaproteobacteria bacterium]
MTPPLADRLAHLLTPDWQGCRGTKCGRVTPILTISLVICLSMMGCDSQVPTAPSDTPIWPARDHWTIYHRDAIPDEYAYLDHTEYSSTTVAFPLRREQNALNAWQDQQQPRISAIYDQLAEAYDNADKHQAVSAQSDLAVDGEPPAGHVSYGLSYESGAKHPTYTREIAGSDKQPKPLLDVNALATGESFYRLVNWVASPSQEWIALVEDVSGHGTSRLRVLNLISGEILAFASIDQIGPDIVWGSDSHLFFVAIDPTSLRPSAVKSITFGETNPLAQIVFSEQDPTLTLSIAAGEQGDDLIINSEGRGTSEIWLAAASDPSPTPYRCLARQNNTRYRLQVDKTQLFVSRLRSGPEARDQFTLLPRAPEGCEVALPKGVQLEEDESLEDFEVLERETLILVRRGATARLIAISHTAPEIPIDVRLPAPWSEGSAVALRFGQLLPNGTFKLYASTPSRPEMPLYYRDSSQPMLGRVVKEGTPRIAQSTVGIAAEYGDHPSVPVTLTLPKTANQSAARPPYPLWVTAYGSYGNTLSTAYSPFNEVVLSLGFAIAHIHVRGGRALGGQWHEAGRGQNKPQSIQDLITATKWLASDPRIESNRIVGFGQSAGAAILAAAANSSPGLFQALILDRPFLDPLPALTARNGPLSATNHHEFGDPRLPDDYRTIRSWSPYEQISRQHYPATYLAGHLGDRRTRANSMIKWAARIRATAINAPHIILDIETEGGHFGSNDATSRRWREASWLAFAEVFTRESTGANQPSRQLAP